MCLVCKLREERREKKNYCKAFVISFFFSFGFIRTNSDKHIRANSIFSAVLQKKKIIRDMHTFVRIYDEVI